jgi:signal transduction histidine kinase
MGATEAQRMNSERDSARSRAAILAQVDLFSRLQPAALARISEELQSLSVLAGADVCHQGERSDGLYVVAGGTFGVYVRSADGRGEARLRTLGFADYFGEMGLITEQPRSATVRAEGDAVVLKLDRRSFLQLLNEEPAVAMGIIGTLSARLQSVSTEVADAKQAARDLLEANARLEASQEKLKELDGLRSEFVSHVSHELRTPLSNMRMSMDNLLEGVAGEVDPKIRRYLQILKQNAERLDRLVTDLLDLARIEAGHVELRCASLPVQKVVEEVVESMEPAAAAKGIALSAAVPEAQAWADRDKVHQILTNLVGNALKFTPSGGKVTVTGRWVGDMAEAQRRRGAEATAESPAIPHSNVIQIAVEDTGEGIPAEDREAIFDKFYQVRRHHQPKTPGAGLGLAITRSLVELHGGRIWAESEVGRGSRFCFTLPGGPSSAGRDLPGT